MRRMSILEEAAKKWVESYKRAWLAQLLLKRSKARLITLGRIADLKEALMSRLQENRPLIYELVFGGRLITYLERRRWKV